MNKERKKIIHISMLIAGIIVAIFIIIMCVKLVDAGFFRSTFSKQVSYKVTTWKPISKNQDCQACNELEYGCSEYQCRSFGKACQLFSFGKSDEFCDKNNDYDMSPPLMYELDILNKDYRYNPEEGVSSPDKGFTLEYNDKYSGWGCLPAFKEIEFGIYTDQPAECKIDEKREYDYSEMAEVMDGGPINHTILLPNTYSFSTYAMNDAGYEIEEGNEYEFYMRCQDVNGGDSPYHLSVKFCVDDGPDTNPPGISTSYDEVEYITSGTTEIDNLQVYTDEPAICRWDFNDIDYDEMSYNMTDCSMDVEDYISGYKFGCNASLVGFKDNEINTYYIRCQDKPKWTANVSDEIQIKNTESYDLNLKGTGKLVIDEIFIDTEKTIYSANGGMTEGIVISDATEVIEVRVDVLTSKGAEKNGNARCEYNSSGVGYKFYNNQNYEYTPLNNHYWNLAGGNYDFGITCCDLANNCDYADINFDVEVDTSHPQIARSYYEDGLMKLITSEESSCVYSLSTCNYNIEEGLQIETDDNINHFVSWDEKESFYVKCKDSYENYPNDCSIIVRAQYEYEDNL